MQIAILGRQPKLSLAELESFYTADRITPIDTYGAIIDDNQALPQSRLGGTIKSAKLITQLDSTDIKPALKYIQNNIDDFILGIPEGKIQFGISLYGFTMSRSSLLKEVLTIKKLVKSSGRSIRIIENKSEALETAQVLYNKLTGPLGIELLIIRDGSGVIIAKTTGLQNIDDYSKRDFNRPKRDAFVGMLPPKLAQIMINLATNGKRSSHNNSLTILDPFCGTGVVLQEALLLGFSATGTDISKKMIDYSQENLKWLNSQTDNHSWNIQVADATKHKWSQEINFVVCETYLGKPLTTLPENQKLEEIISEANLIAEQFLTNLAPQLTPGTRLCIALPAWYLKKDTFLHLPVLDQIAKLGYNRLDTKYANYQDLIYHRENQIVARELTILEKI